MAKSLRPNHCWTIYSRSMVSLPNDGRPVDFCRAIASIKATSLHQGSTVSTLSSNYAVRVRRAFSSSPKQRYLFVF